MNRVPGYSERMDLLRDQLAEYLHPANPAETELVQWFRLALGPESMRRLIDMVSRIDATSYHEGYENGLRARERAGGTDA